MTTTFTGHCLCGALSIELAGRPKRVSLCHCRMCARHTGAPFVHLAVYDAPDVTVNGETYGYESSSGVDRRGCKACGAPVYIYVDTSKEFEVYVGALDEPGEFPPEYEIFDEHRPAWLGSIDNVPTYKAYRE